MESTTFEGVSDRYNGITVDSQEEPCETNDFLNKLKGKFKGHHNKKYFLRYPMIVLFLTLLIYIYRLIDILVRTEETLYMV